MPNGSHPPSNQGLTGWSLMALVACLLAQADLAPPVSPDRSRSEPDLAWRIDQLREQLGAAAPALTPAEPMRVAQWRNV
jgi:hypothetical protein